MASVSKSKQIIISLAALLLIVLYYYFFEIKKAKDEGVQNYGSKMLFPGLTRGMITELRIQNKNGVFNLKKEDSGWVVMSGGKKDYADAMTVDGLLSTLDSKIYLSNVPGADMGQFGLSKPRAQLDVLTNSKTSFTLYIGEKNGTGGLVYVAKPNDPDVYIVESNMEYLTTMDFFNYRFRGALKLDAEKVMKIVVNFKDRKYTAIKEGKLWNLVLPVKSKIRLDRIKNLIDACRGTSVKAMINATRDNLAKYGLSDSCEYLEFYEEGGEAKKVFFGRYDRKNMSYFAKNSMVDDILVVPEYIYQNTPSQEQIVNRQVVFFEPEEVRQVEVSRLNKMFLAEKYKANSYQENWKLMKVSGFDPLLLNDIRMGNIVSALYSMDYAEEVKTPDADQARSYGFTKGAYAIKLFGEENKIIGTVIVGGKKPGAPAYVYLKIPERNKIYVVSASSVDGIRIHGLEEEMK